MAYGGGNRSGSIPVAAALAALAAHGRRQDFEVETFIAFEGQNLGHFGADEAATCLDTGAAHSNRGIHVAHSLRGEGFDASEDGTGRGTPLVPVAFTQNSGSEVREIGGDGQVVGALAADAGAQQQNYVAFQQSQSGVRQHETHATLDANNGSRRMNGALTTMGVRRLTPRECERLQGFPDDFTLVPYRKGMMADGPRYKMLGNSWARPVGTWIGERIVMVEDILSRLAEAA